MILRRNNRKDGIPADVRRAIYHRFYLVVAFFLPPALRSGGDFRPGQRAYFIVMAGLALAPWFWSEIRDRNLIQVFYASVLYTSCVVVYFIATTIMFGSGLRLGDTVDLFRPAVYWAFFMLPVLLKISDKEWERLIRLFVGIMAFGVAFSFLAFIEPAWPIVDIYKGRLSNDPWQLQFFRFSGTFGYPGLFAMYLVLPILFTWFYLNCNESTRTLSLARDKMYMLSFAVGLFLTASRAGIAAMVATVPILLFKTRREGIKVIIGGAVIAVAITFAVPDGLKERVGEEVAFATDYIERLGNERGDEGSVGHRVRELKLALTLASEVPPFGTGPNRAFLEEHHGPMESMYGHYLGKFGFIGLLAWGLHHALVAWAGYKAQQREPRGSVGAAFTTAWGIWVFIAVLVMGLVTGPADQFRGAVLYYFLAGHIVVRAVRSRRVE